jgi:hypothetical protein
MCYDTITFTHSLQLSIQVEACVQVPTPLCTPEYLLPSLSWKYVVQSERSGHTAQQKQQCNPLRFAEGQEPCNRGADGLFGRGILHERSLLGWQGKSEWSQYPTLPISIFKDWSKESQSYLTTDGQSASPSWCQARIWDPWPISLSPQNFL